MSILDRVEQGQRIEDSTVELKSKFICSVKAAEVLAGHANAALGEQLLWLIGVDEKQGAVVGIDQTELKDWLSKVNKRFDEIAPTLIKDLVVPRNGFSVLALVFETDRAPYVVKHDNKPQRWVPWRYGADTQPAKRSELLRMLLPTIKAPKIEVLQGSFTCKTKPSSEVRQDGKTTELNDFIVTTSIYFIPAMQSEAVTIPAHKIKGSLVFPEWNYRLEHGLEGVSPVSIDALEVDRSPEKIVGIPTGVPKRPRHIGQELIFCDISKTIQLQQSFCTKEFPIKLDSGLADISPYKKLQATYELEFVPDQFDRPIKLSIPLNPSSTQPRRVNRLEI